MKLIRLTIENWRGVGSRSVTFGDSVTLLAGPNEAGKSTLIEALRLLFYHPDSSRRKEVQAVRPAGEDVGSRVEAEVEVEDYRFVYAKTYNRRPATSLNILAPAKRQFTGREAHQEVEKILTEHVDMTLWEALLLDQGNAVGQAALRESEGLARALDEAAGSASADADEGALFRVVEEYYSQYFTLKQGQVRFTSLEQSAAKAAERLARATDQYDAVAGDIEQRDRAESRMATLEQQARTQRARVRELEQQDVALKALQGELDAGARNLERASEALRAATETREERARLVAQVEKARRALDEGRSADQPLAQQIERAARELAAARKGLANAEAEEKRTRRELDIATADERHVERQEKLARDRQRLEQLGDTDRDMQGAREELQKYSVDDDAIANMQEAESDLRVARGQLEAAASELSLTAAKDIELESGDESEALRRGNVWRRTVTDKTSVTLPGIATITVAPSGSATQLREVCLGAERALARLFARHELDSLDDAVVAHQRRRDILQTIERLQARRDTLLGDDDASALATAVQSLEADCDAYLRERDSDAAIPADAAAARSRRERAAAAHEEALSESARRRKETAELETRQDGLEQENRSVHDAALRRQASTEALEKQLEEARERAADAALDEAVEVSSADVGRLNSEVAALRSRIEEQGGNLFAQRLSNALAAENRTREELDAARRDYSTSSSLLERARADGRFEELDAARRDHERAERELAQTRRRANAARRLYETLRQHRDAARRAYVRPLKDAIERFGELVFGSGFEVEVNEDWRIASRTLEGITLPFGDLSVGAREQLDIITRLAAAQIVARHGGVPLILDDALGFSDTSRLEKMSEAIAIAGQSCQIVLLTSIPERFGLIGNATVQRLDDTG